MIRYEYDNSKATEWGGLWFPVVICDACLRRIEREPAGHACWDEAGNLYHAHKGACDAVLRRAKAANYWEQLGPHLRHIGANLDRVNKAVPKSRAKGK